MNEDNVYEYAKDTLAHEFNSHCETEGYQLEEPWEMLDETQQEGLIDTMRELFEEAQRDILETMTHQHFDGAIEVAGWDTADADDPETEDEE